MKQMIIFGLMTVLAIGFGTQNAQAQPLGSGNGQGFSQADGSRNFEPGMRRGGPGGFHKMRWLRQMDLSEEQQEQVRALREKTYRDMESTKNELDNIQKQKRALWGLAEPDEDAILALHNKMVPLKNKLHAAKFAMRLSVIDLLTPEQNQKRMEFMANRDCRRGNKGKRGWKGKRGNGRGF